MATKLRSKSKKTVAGGSHVVLRVPGPWTSKQELIERLPEDCHLDEELLCLPEGPHVELQMVPADREFPQIFRSACRRRDLSAAASAELQGYRHNVALLAPAGSIPWAQHVLAAGAVIIRAGGIGVFIDNSGLAHEGSHWLDLAQHRCNPQALMYAFVNFIKEQNGGVTSLGMHVFGQRDGSIHPCTKLPSLEDFLLMICCMHPSLDEGFVFADQQGNRFRLEKTGKSEFQDTHPMNNPFGSWRLQSIT